MNKVAITGVAGFIGSHLLERLLKDGNEVVGIDNFDSYYPNKDKNIDHLLADGRFTFIKGDILDLQSLRSAFAGVDAVYHLAAQPGVRISIKDPVRSNTVNTTGTLNVLIAARDCGVKKVINSSSSSVYGNVSGGAVTENVEKHPVSPYAISKLAAEYYVENYRQLYGIDTVSMRYFTVYGPRQRPDMSIRIFLEKLLKNESPTVFGNGEQSRDFTYVGDVVDALARCLACPKLGGGGMNISNGNTVTVNKVLSLLKTYLGRENVSIVYSEVQQGDVDCTWGDNTRVRKLLGWSPKVTIDEGLRRMVDWKNSPVH